MWFLQWTGLYISRALAQSPFASSTPDPTGGAGGGIQIENPLSCDEWTECIQGFLGTLTLLAMPVAGIMILVGGFQIMFSGGEPEKVKKGKNTVIYTAVGYGVILLATGVATIIQSIVDP
jgi:hypothetical protein